MSTLVCHVRHLLPFSVVTMAGTLDEQSMIKAGMVLRDCLAAQPVALIIEAANLSVVGDRPLAWLRIVGADAAEWPGVPVMICDGPAAFAATGTLRFATIGAAINSATLIPVPPMAQIELPPVIASCAAARRHVTATCRSWGLRRLSRLAEVLASELVANAVRHARTPMVLTVRNTDVGLEVNVRDGDPRRVYAAAAPTRGAGLELVSALATAWGCASTADGKVVWVRIEGQTTPNRLREPSARVKSDGSHP